MQAEDKKTYWYRMYVGYCPVCGRDASFRERVYGPKPEKMEDRYEQLGDDVTYDHCIEHEALR